MATFVRNRVVTQLSWVAEDDRPRAQRREPLCTLDGLLIHVEEANLRGRPIPQRVIAELQRHGVPTALCGTPAELIEAVFARQEHFMRQPDGDVRSEQRRRIAS